MKPSRDLRRMDSNSHSPLYSQFGEMLEGIVTVRAFSAEGQFLQTFYKSVDLTNKVCQLVS
jgi:hypothetical protein